MLTHRLAGLVLASLIAFSATAAAELSLNPRRAVFNEGDRSASLTLMNRGTGQETYRLYWVYRRMDESLGLRAVQNADQVGTPSAESFIRYSPRQVTLEAGQTQTVRLLLRRPPNLAMGEYRAHLMFEREPDVFTSGDASRDGLSISLNVAYGLTIPVIVRSGQIDHQVTLESAELNRDGERTTLRLQVSRRGESSVFGRLRVTHQQGEVETTLAHVPNFAIYSETARGEAEITLDIESANLQDGLIRIQLLDREEAREPLLSEIVLPVNE